MQNFEKLFQKLFVITFLNFFNAKKYLMWKYLSEQSLINLNLI